MINKIKSIFNLTKIFFKNSFENPYLIDKKTNKINKKSIYVWLLVIVMMAVTFLSFEIINYLVKINNPSMFLSVFFLILMIIMIFQITLASTNVYFFSKDLELILPLPIKSEELLISKFNTILINLYFSEFIFALFPLLIYGILTSAGLLYYFYLIIILLIFPVFPALVISIIMMFLMKLSKFIKNKDVFQIIVTLLFICLIFLLEIKIGGNLVNRLDNNFNLENQETISAFNNFNNKMSNLNKYFLIINPSINILNNFNKINAFLNLLKIILINLVFLILFIFIGKKYYLKNILKNNNYYLKKINNKNIKNKLKKINIGRSYIKKEFKNLFKNPTFFMQCIFPILIIMVSLFIIVYTLLPNIRTVLTSDIFGDKINFSVDLSVICLIIGLLQILSTILNISITSISREGKDAIYMKIIPVDYFKQFIYKSIPQILINGIVILIILIFIKIIFPSFENIYLLFIFILANLFSIINSKLMVLVDLNKPNLNWKADYEAIKQNNNKLFQYVLTILIILILVYFNKIFVDINLNISCILMIAILIFINFIINKIIKLNIKKLFKKIY